MLEVINNQKLRESLIARGYEYVERNGWDRKKKEYLDLIDSLSTECFEDIEPALSAALEFQRNHNQQASTGPTNGQVGSLAMKLSDPASVSSSEGKLAPPAAPIGDRRGPQCPRRNQHGRGISTAKIVNRKSPDCYVAVVGAGPMDFPQRRTCEQRK